MRTSTGESFAAFYALFQISICLQQTAGLAGQPDPAVISWAAANGRVLLTHDLNTMVDAALERVRIGQSMRGVIAVPQYMGIGAVISDLLMIATCAEPSELTGQIWYLPL